MFGPQFEFTSLYEPAVRGKIPPTPAKIMRLLREEQNDLLMSVLSAPTREHFIEARKTVAQRYHELAEAVRNVSRSRFDTLALAQLNLEAVHVVTAMLEKTARAKMGAEPVNEALFALATLQRSLRLIDLVRTAPAPEGRLDEDKAIAKRYRRYLFTFEMHFHMFMLVLYQGIEVRPFVLAEILEGVRAVVMMYGSLSAALEIRGLIPSNAPIVDELDEEDLELLKASALDVCPEDEA